MAQALNSSLTMTNVQKCPNVSTNVAQIGAAGWNVQPPNPAVRPICEYNIYLLMTGTYDPDILRALFPCPYNMTQMAGFSF